jgi:hypothetical protein
MSASSHCAGILVYQPVHRRQWWHQGRELDELVGKMDGIDDDSLADKLAELLNNKWVFGLRS